MAGAQQPRTMYSQNGRTRSRVLITPLPAGRVGNYSILAYVRTQAAIFCYLNGKSRFDLLLYIKGFFKNEKRSEQYRYDNTCIAPTLVVAFAPVVSQQRSCCAAFAPLWFSFLGH